MKLTKRIIALILVIITIISIVSISASAASTSTQCVVSYSAVNGGKISSRQINYTIKGSALSEKKVTIKPSTSQASFTCKGDTSGTGYRFYKNNAYFNYKIYDTNGKLLRQGQHRFNESFKLPKGSKNYTVEIWSYYEKYNTSNAFYQIAAMIGKYNLSY